MKRIIVLSLILWCSLSKAAAAQAQADGPVYVVDTGDSYWAIADTFKVTIPDLLAANGFADNHVINPGDRLIIPGYGGIHGVLAFRTVELGDTLETLALRTGVPAETLMRLNRLVNPKRLYVGQALIIVEPEEESAAGRWETGRALALSAGTPLLALAAAEGMDPWELAGMNGLSSAADQFSGQTLLAVGGEQPLRAWPDPITEIQFRSLPLVQGTTGEILLTLAADGEAEGAIGETSLNFRAWDGKLAALQGIHAQAKVQTYPFTLTVASADGRSVHFEQDVLVASGEYPVEPDIKVPPETLNLDTIQAENDLVNSIVAPFTEERYWTNTFLVPVGHGISSYFGGRRSYNDGTYYYFHTGVDFYGQNKEPFFAPAPGRVVFAGPLAICGNTTIIDHGWGVYTRYCHQHTIEVQPGEMVHPGQEIGLIGNTGRSQGAHLHWEVWVGGIQVNPLLWIEELYP
jgi:murein DD-endopeptidase MepM/ murein hydrolase activator NlpD